MNVGQLLAESARRFPERPAVTWGDRSLNYGELDRRTNALARALGVAGLAKGDRVGVLMRNRPEALEAMFACFKAGYCLVPLNSRFTSEEVAFHVQDSGAGAVLTDSEGEAVVLGAGCADLTVVVAGGGQLGEGVLNHERLVAEHDSSPISVDVDRDDLAWLFYTSGTTGRPKGAMLSHGILGFVTASWLADITPMDERDVTLHAAPLSHGAGFHALAATARGAHQVIPPEKSFDPRAILALLGEARVTNTWLVPTQIVMLLDALGDESVHLPSLRYVVYGGAPFPPADLREALEAFGPIFVQLFGQGETPMTATVLSVRDHVEAMGGDRPERLASAGVARPGTDVRILGEDGEELPSPGVGEVCVRGGAVMLGYWNRPGDSAEALRGGWLHTGDLGRADEHGYIYLLDRAKDMIISGGSNVYAVEVEAVLAAHPAVREVAVVGMPDRTWGEVVTAVVVPRDGIETGELAATLATHCNATLAGYKRPRRFVLRETLPRNAYGKVLKRALRDELAEG
jgi:acyl-CoA synthetase (AMP-forming)/AMP-acid ligase II